MDFGDKVHTIDGYIGKIKGTETGGIEEIFWVTDRPHPYFKWQLTLIDVPVKCKLDSMQCIAIGCGVLTKLHSNANTCPYRMLDRSPNERWVKMKFRTYGLQFSDIYCERDTQGRVYYDVEVQV